MKKQAKDYRTKLLKQIEDSIKRTVQPATADGTNQAANIKQKLVNAIAAMQEGLVERESEVRDEMVGAFLTPGQAAG